MCLFFNLANCLIPTALLCVVETNIAAIFAAETVHGPFT